MPRPIILYCKYVDYVCEKVGRLAMYSVFLMIVTLTVNAFTRNVINYPLSWGVELAQFTLAAYYFLGGPYSMQTGDHVRMDLFYERFSDTMKAKVDMVTTVFLVFYLVALLIGAISSTAYAIEYNQRKFSQWNPSMIPIKLIMVFGIVLMLLQSFSIFFKDLAKVQGKEIKT